MRDWLKYGGWFLSAEIQQIFCFYRGPSFVHMSEGMSWGQQSFTSVPAGLFHTLSFSPSYHTLGTPLLEQNGRKHQAYRVGAEYQPQLWIRVWLMGWRGTPVTLGPRKQSWENDWVNEAHANNQCVSIGPDLTNKFERYWFISDLKVSFSTFNAFKTLLTILWL